MVEIVEKGPKPEVECPRCKSKLVFEWKEIESEITTTRDKMRYWVVCPVCYKSIDVNHLFNESI